MMVKALSNEDIYNILKKHDLPIVGIFSKDEIPEHLIAGWYIINLQNSTAGNGTHWTCFKKGIKNLYFDSFGFVFPNEVKERLTDITYNHKEIQNINSIMCGYFCIALINELEKSVIKDDLLKFNHFISRFSKNTLFNDEILKRYLMNNHISY
jgi:dimeric dUTPase (all-alpha-NTP-PPase superfamily)